MSLKGVSFLSSQTPHVSNGKMDSEDTPLPKPIPQELVPPQWNSRKVEELDIAVLKYLPRDIWEKIIEEFLVEMPFLCDFYRVVKRSSLPNKLLLSGLINGKILAHEEFDGFCESEKIDVKALKSMIKSANLVKPLETLNLRKFSQNELFRLLMKDYQENKCKFYPDQLKELSLSTKTIPGKEITLPLSLKHLDYRSDQHEVSAFEGLPFDLFLPFNLSTLTLANLTVKGKFFDLLTRTLEKIDISCCTFNQVHEKDEIFFDDFPFLEELSLCETCIDDEFLVHLPVSLKALTVMNCASRWLEPPIMISKDSIPLLPNGLLSLTAFIDDEFQQQHLSLNFPPLHSLTSKCNLVDSSFIKALPKTLVRLILKVPVLDVYDNFLRYLPKTLQELQLINIKIKDWNPHYVHNWNYEYCFDLGNIAMLPQSLTKLRLSGRQRERIILKTAIFRALPPNLIELDVGELGGAIRDEDIQFLPRKLSSLKIKPSGQISDEGIGYLPRTLVSLHLGCMNISAKGIKKLPRGLTSLRLTLSRISTEAIKNLPRGLTSLALDAPLLNDEQLNLLPKKLKYLKLTNLLNDAKMKLLPRSLCYLHLPIITLGAITPACIPDLPPMLSRCLPDFEASRYWSMKFGLYMYEKEFESYEE